MRTILIDPAEPSGGELSHPEPERLLSGNPQRATFNRVDCPLGQARASYAGVWTSEVGHWKIAMGNTEQEVFTVLSGRCRVHDVEGGFHEVGPGQALFIPPGFVGSFEVLEPLTKTYVICE